MKELVRNFLPIAALFALPAISVQAQEPGENMRFKMAPDGKAQIEITKAMGSQFGFETKVVKGAPYSAIAESETIQTLGDGNRLRNNSTTQIYRDSEGRTRREVTGTTPGVPAEVFINDPVGGLSYSLSPKQQTAVKMQPGASFRIIEDKITEAGAGQISQEGQRTATINVNGQPVPVEKVEELKRTAIEQKRQAPDKQGETATMTLKTAGKPAGEYTVVARKKRQGTTVSLGKQMIEGVMCEGERTTMTIAPGSIGNDLPINIVSEEWYSPELQVFVMTKQSDPRHGETTYRLTSINRGEQARALFEVPSHYTLRDFHFPAPVIKKRRTASQEELEK
ncbi:MAG: hypothetical protein ACKV2V_12160 [Blastocatellia bacterium]